MSNEKRIAILGSTGSIGTNAIDVIRSLGSGYRVVALAARSNWRLLREQIDELRPSVALLTDPVAAQELRRSQPPCRIESPEALDSLGAFDEANFVLGAITGAAGLGACLKAASTGKTLALANKEALVMAGPLLLEAARRSGGSILPVDSEHSGVFQALRAGSPREVRRVTITASGGAFRDLPLERFANVTPEEALRHPTWNMGAKITIDSATMMNKALEVIEAKWLFGLPMEQIGVLIHPQSIVHALVEFQDGSVIAQMGMPDMRVPIQFALTWPERAESSWKPLDLGSVGSLTFQPVDPRRFPALELGYRAAREGGTMGAVLNASNEVAVEAFLARRLSFPRITSLVREVMDTHRPLEAGDLESIREADRWARAESSRRIGA